MMVNVAPVASIIVPLYNEERSIIEMIQALGDQLGADLSETEILLCENGSTDRTLDIALQLESEQPNIRVLSLSRPSYGAALKMGIREAHADIVVIFNADLWCQRFFLDAVALLQNGFDVVIASKRHPASIDRRPLVRRLITRAFNTLLRFAFAFNGTDTHGMKAMRRSRVIDLVAKCRTEREVFDTELMLRCQHAGLKMCELPVNLSERRSPRLSLLRRLPSTARDMVIIWATLGRA